MILVSAVARADPPNRHAGITALHATTHDTGPPGTIRKIVTGEGVKPGQFQIVTDEMFRCHGVVNTFEVITPPAR